LFARGERAALIHDELLPKTNSVPAVAVKGRRKKKMDVMSLA